MVSHEEFVGIPKVPLFWQIFFSFVEITCRKEIKLCVFIISLFHQIFVKDSFNNVFSFKFFFPFDNR